MIERTLTFDDLHVRPEDVYEQMGYGDSMPDELTVTETSYLLEDVRRILRPRFCFFLADGVLDRERETLEAVGRHLGLGRIITRQLSGSQRYAFFVATAGEEFEKLQEELKAGGDMVKIFIADAIGSVLAEKTADRMEEALEELLAAYGWKHTNRFSPGYCGWHVREQHDLFSMFPTEAPCGVTLTPSALMTPIKSVSGVIGVGEKVRKLDYTCGLCDFKQCYKRKKPAKNRKNYNPIQNS